MGWRRGSPKKKKKPKPSTSGFGESGFLSRKIRDMGDPSKRVPAWKRRERRKKGRK